MVEEQRRESEKRIMAEFYEKRIKSITDQNEFVALSTDDRKKQQKQIIIQLEIKLRMQEHELFC